MVQKRSTATPHPPRLSSGVQTGAAQLSQQSKTLAEVVVVVAKLPPPPPHINPWREFVDWSLSGHHSEDKMSVRWRMTPAARVPHAELCAECSSWLWQTDWSAGTYHFSKQQLSVLLCFNQQYWLFPSVSKKLSNLAEGEPFLFSSYVWAWILVLKKE